jgi:hypothetical protein
VGIPESQLQDSPLSADVVPPAQHDSPSAPPPPAREEAAPPLPADSGARYIIPSQRPHGS